MTLSRSEVEEIVDLAVTRCFDRLGFDMSEPHEMQQDLIHLRRSRRLFDKAGVTIVTSTIGIVLTGVAAAIWSALARH